MNVDNPSCKDLATASRFAHTVGVCHLAERLMRTGHVAAADADVLIAVAVLHDMGIPPFGHLVEQALDELDPPFNHEVLARKIVEGTYAPENKYHQIFADQSLKLGSILDRHHVDTERVFRILAAESGPSLISGAVDLDNIDNLVRMAALLGLGHHKQLAYTLISSLKVVPDGTVLIPERAVAEVLDLMRIRALCYEIMLYTEENIAYSALLHELAILAVTHKLITKDAWFLTDDAFLRVLCSQPVTKSLAKQLLTGLRYKTLAAVRVDFSALAGAVLNSNKKREFTKQLADEAGLAERDWASIFVWYEYGKVSRTIRIADQSHQRVIGSTSSSALVALIQKRRPQKSGHGLGTDFRRSWPQLVQKVACNFGQILAVNSIRGLEQVGLEVDEDDVEFQPRLF